MLESIDRQWKVSADARMQWQGMSSQKLSGELMPREAPDAKLEPGPCWCWTVGYEERASLAKQVMMMIGTRVRDRDRVSRHTLNIGPPARAGRRKARDIVSRVLFS